MAHAAVESLSRVETSLLASWERSGQTRITLDDLIASAPHHDPYVLASSLVRKGLLHRVAPGKFLVRALRTAGREWSPTAIAAAVAILTGKNYYVVGGLCRSIGCLSRSMGRSLTSSYRGAGAIAKCQEPAFCSTCFLRTHSRGASRSARSNIS